MTPLPLTPYTAFDGFTFGLDPESLVAWLGPPQRCSRNGVALDEYDYGHGVFRFQDGGRLEEITRRTPALQLGSVVIPFTALAAFVRTQDDDAFERAGFLVSPALGIAFVPSEPDWVTALARHCIPSWREL
jgi:hypothetical protein